MKSSADLLLQILKNDIQLPPITLASSEPSFLPARPGPKRLSTVKRTSQLAKVVSGPGIVLTDLKFEGLLRKTPYGIVISSAALECERLVVFMSQILTCSHFSHLPSTLVLRSTNTSLAHIAILLLSVSSHHCKPHRNFQIFTALAYLHQQHGAQSHAARQNIFEEANQTPHIDLPLYPSLTSLANGRLRSP